MNSMNHIELAAGQKAYSPVASWDGEVKERKVTIVHVGNIVEAVVPEFGADYGVVRIDPAKTFVVAS